MERQPGAGLRPEICSWHCSTQLCAATTAGWHVTVLSSSISFLEGLNRCQVLSWPGTELMQHPQTCQHPHPSQQLRGEGLLIRDLA